MSMFQHTPSIDVIYHINRMKGKTHITISIDVEKAYDKIQQTFIIRIHNNKKGIEWNFLNL